MKALHLQKTKLIFWLGHAGFIGITSILLFWLSPAVASEATEKVPAIPAEAISWGYLAAAISTGLAALGAGIAVSNVGSAAIGAMAEKPEILGRALIVIGLAEGIAIYGLIISILILNQII
jgi:V/A-type H+-transporting ATPase subunit K